MSHHQIQCWWTLVPPCTLYIVYMYVLFLLCLLCTNVQSSWRHNCRPRSSTQKGDPNGPFFLSCPAGHVTPSTGPRAAYVHIVHSTWRPNGCSPSSSQKGDPNGPLSFIQPCGAFYLATGTRTRAHQRYFIFGPRVHL